MKEPLKTGRVTSIGLSLLRCFPCSVPVDTTISTTISMTRVERESSRAGETFLRRLPTGRGFLPVARGNKQLELYQVANRGLFQRALK